MIPIILVRYGEIHLKGQNRPRFEKMLKDNGGHFENDQ